MHLWEKKKILKNDVIRGNLNLQISLQPSKPKKQPSMNMQCAEVLPVKDGNGRCRGIVPD